MKNKKIFLPEDERITQWYNILPDIPNGIEPPLDPEDTTYRSTQIHNIEPRFGYLRIRKDW